MSPKTNNIGRGKMVGILKKNVWVIGLMTVVFGVGVWVTTANLTMAAQGKKINSNSEAIKQIAENQGEILKIQNKMLGRLDMMIQMLGIQVPDSTIQRWRKVPKKLPIDSTGKPVGGAEWLSVSHDYLLGQTFKWVNDDSLFVRIEWDEREHTRGQP